MTTRMLQGSTAPLLRLVPRRAENRVPAVDADVVQALEILLEEARQGRLAGVAFVGIQPDRCYYVDTVGEARSSPVFTRGALRSLDDQLASCVRVGQ